MKKKLSSIIQNAKAVSICADFWTAKDGLGYLGITVSILQGSERNDYLLALRHIDHPHTGAVVASSIENVLNEYGILGLEDPKLISISTDNGSNMVSGLKNVSEMPESKECIVEVTDDDNIKEIDDQDIFFEVCYSKRIPCSNHILNNNLKNSINACESVKKIVKDVKDLIKKLKYKGVVIDYIKEKKLSKLLLPPETRWQYCYQMLTSLITIRASLPHLCSLAGIDNLSVLQYQEIESLLKILELYSIQIKEFENKNSKLSDAIPAIMNLDAELTDKNSHKEFILKLQQDLRKRTKCMFDPKDTTFNSIFALSTFLDPHVKKYLNFKINGYDLDTLRNYIFLKLRRMIDNKKEPSNSPKVAKVSFSALEKYMPNEIEDGDELNE